MKTLTVRVKPEYEIYIGSGVLKSCGEIIAKKVKGKKAVIVTDDIVSDLYAKSVALSLNEQGVKTDIFVFENGEHSKSHEILIKLYDYLSEKQMTRSDFLVALGGGVVGDLTGFAAATYLRGLEVVQLPTTLLAMTDSSIGGKTAVNIKSGKNLVGAFKQPACVICDTNTLKTLSDEIFTDGMSEVIKYGMIKDAALFELLNKKADDTDIEQVILKCAEIKKTVVESDEFDKGERMLLNFGHTLGHAIEKYYNYNGISHGKAVAVGMCMMSYYTEKAGLTQKG
ncbi:MAG: 3-dehydroquinate synthase, partial [Oscillospiraceae bacterium]